MYTENDKENVKCQHVEKLGEGYIGFFSAILETFLELWKYFKTFQNFTLHAHFVAEKTGW